MTPQNLTVKRRNKTVSKLIPAVLFLTLSLGTLGLVEGTTLKESDSIASFLENDPLGIQLEQEQLKSLPTVTLVDKNLNLVAQFYGDPVRLKTLYADLFEEAIFLVEYNQRRVYVVPTQKTD